MTQTETEMPNTCLVCDGSGTDFEETCLNCGGTGDRCGLGHEYDIEGASCVFGCGTVIGETGICPVCSDYSENVVMCHRCGEVTSESLVTK